MSNIQDVHDDLAFMKSLVAEGGRAQMTGGSAFLAGGLLYGLQCLVHWSQAVGLTHFCDLFMLIFVIAITAAFLIFLTIVVVKDAKSGPSGIASKAITAVFAGGGLANIAMTIVFGTVSAREQSMLIWMLYPAVVCAFQGAGWYVAYMLRRRAWLVLISLGWFATAITLGLAIEQTNTYILVIGVALILFMALPGYVMLRLAKRPA